MEKTQLLALQNLSQRMTLANGIGYGSAKVTVFATDPYALEEAIKLLTEYWGDVLPVAEGGATG